MKRLANRSDKIKTSASRVTSTELSKEEQNHNFFFYYNNRAPPTFFKLYIIYFYPAHPSEKKLIYSLSALEL